MMRKSEAGAVTPSWIGISIRIMNPGEYHQDVRIGGQGCESDIAHLLGAGICWMAKKTGKSIPDIVAAILKDLEFIEGTAMHSSRQDGCKY